MRTDSFVTVSAALLFLPAVFGETETIYKCTGASFSSLRELKYAQQVCHNHRDKPVASRNRDELGRKDSKKYHVVLNPQKEINSQIKKVDRVEYIAEYQESDCKLIHVFETKMGLNKYCHKTFELLQKTKQENLKTLGANRQGFIQCGEYAMRISYLKKAATSGCQALQRFRQGHPEPHIKELLKTKLPDSKKYYKPGTLFEWPFRPDGHFEQLGKNPGIYRIIINSECRIVGFHVPKHIDGSIEKNDLYCTLTIPQT